jgi:glutamine cyclotransferase
MRRLLACSSLAVVLVAALGSARPSLLAQAAPARKAAVPVSSYKVVKVYPHDRAAFTQGLVYLDGVIYEGTGLNGQSSIRKVKLETGEVLQRAPLDERYFGEGIVNWGPTLLQLTWQAETGFVYDLATFKRIKSFSYTGEGWGLTQDGTRIIMSDGTAALRFLDPVTLKETGRVTVKDGTTPVDRLNELEFVKGEILANVWTTERIARISPKTGQVTGWIDLSGLKQAAGGADVDVLNGIAYDAKGDRLFVTGKLWPKLFEIRLVPAK